MSSGQRKMNARELGAAVQSLTQAQRDELWRRQFESTRLNPPVGTTSVDSREPASTPPLPHPSETEADPQRVQTVKIKAKRVKTARKPVDPPPFQCSQPTTEHRRRRRNGNYAVRTSCGGDDEHIGTVEVNGRKCVWSAPLTRRQRSGEEPLGYQVSSVTSSDGRTGSSW